MQSSPWYTGIFIYGIVTLIFLAVLLIVKLNYSKKDKDRGEVSLITQ